VENKGGVSHKKCHKKKKWKPLKHVDFAKESKLVCWQRRRPLRSGEVVEKVETFVFKNANYCVATLLLGSQPKQGLAKVRAKSET